MILLEPDYALIQAKGLVAQALLDNIGNNTVARYQITQRDIAARIGSDWETVHMSLQSLQYEGAIRIERHRMIINKELLQKVARVIANIPSGRS
jgi:DNA-binding MarR family transcriptional regulator